jgi:hypothetical protein
MSVSLWSARLMIGAGQFDATAVRSGAAFFYELEAGSWVQGPEIGPPGSDGFDQFGISVGLYGNQALAGANLEEPQPGFSGAAYFWNRMPILGSWSLAKKYIVPDTGNPFAPDDFGYAVALADLLAVVSSPDADGLAPSSGVVHALGRVNGKWHPSATLFASDGSEAQSFGWSLATTDACALVGAPGDDDNGAFSGAAYVYCGLPPPVVLTDLQVICCENVPSIGSVLIQIGWSTPGLAAVQATRRVLLYRPDGSFEEVAARAPIEIEPGAQAQEQIEHALPAGFFGPFAIVVEWEDANGSHSETALFSHAPAGVPGLAPGALGLLALALLTTGAGLYSAHGAARRRVRLSLRRMGV